MATLHFADRLAGALDRAGTPACVGLDPVIERIPAAARAGAASEAEAIGRFCEGVLRACAGVVPVVKPQSACFERYGAAGVGCLAGVCRRARELGFVVLLDAKRGDIGISAEHYAAAAFGAGGMGADAVTVSPYLGPDTIEPYLGDASRGVFVLVRTSNPGSDAVQSMRLGPPHEGRTVAEMIAGQVAALGATRRGGCGLSSVGAVVGATKAADAAALRAIMPDTVFLVPGYGAQGGTAEDIRGMLRAGRTSVGTSGVLVTASRSVIYPAGGDGADWEGAIAGAARKLGAELAGVVG